MTVLKDSLAIIRKHSVKPPVQIKPIVEEMGLGLRFEALPAQISGVIRRTDRYPAGYEIIVNSTHARTRQRFTAAHELGHYIYHRDLLESGVGDTRAYRAEGTSLPNPNIQIQHERQANAFAANLLMPSHLIRELREKGIAEVRKLAEALDVSEEAMRIKLGLHHRNLFSEFEDDVA